MAITVYTYNHLMAEALKGNFDGVNDELRISLVNDYVFDADHTDWSSASSYELANGNGYTVGGELLLNKTVEQVDGIVVWDSSDILWSPDTIDLGPTTGAVIRNVTAGNKLVSYIDFGGSTSFPVGEDAIITFGSGGLLTDQPVV